VVAGTEADVHRREDRLLRAGEDDHVVGADTLVQLRDRLAKEWGAGDRRVAEAEPSPHVRRFVVRQGEELVEAQGLRVRGREHVRGRELVAVEVVLEREVGDLHAPDRA